MARWLQVIAEYDFEIVHRAGRSHANADGLSRRPCPQCKRNFEESEIADGQIAPEVEVPRDSEAEARAVTIEPSISNEQMSQDQA